MNKVPSVQNLDSKFCINNDCERKEILKMNRHVCPVCDRNYISKCNCCKRGNMKCEKGHEWYLDGNAIKIVNDHDVRLKCQTESLKS